MAEQDVRKIAIYSRKSKFTGKGDSVENQVELCREEGKHSARQEGFELSDDDFLAYEDEGFSGKNMERPGFQKMMKAVRAGQIRMIICYRLDRISRDTGDFSDLIKELNARDVSFISVRDKFDTTTPTGKAMMLMVSVFAQLERETIAERIIDNLDALAETGRWLGGQCPTGYASKLVEIKSNDSKTRTLHQLVIVPDQMEIVKLIYSTFLATNSQYQVLEVLRKKKLQTKTKKDFSRYAVHNILTNPVYMIADQDAYDYFASREAVMGAEEEQFDGSYGVMVYKKTQQNAGKTNKVRPFTEWIVAVGKHPGVISGKDWVRVQDMMQGNSRKSADTKQNARSNVALLSGLLRCGECGSYMRPKLSQRMSKEYGEYIYDYLCETKEKSKGEQCNSRRANGNTLDRLVCAEVAKQVQPGSAFLESLEKAKNQIKGNASDQEKMLAAYRKQVESCEQSITKLLQSFAQSNEITVEDVQKEIARLRALIESKKEQIAELEAISNSQALSDEEFNLLRDMLTSFARSFETMTVEQKRIALRAFIDKIVWDGKEAVIYLFGSEGEISPELPALDPEKAAARELQMKS